MIASIEKRREVAKRLRVLASHREVDKDLFHDAIGVWSGGCLDGYDPVNVMELADLIEPEPRPTCRDDGAGVFRCTRCGAFVERGSAMDCCGPIPIRFCPNCGAEVVE